MANFYSNIPIHNTFGIDVRAEKYVEYSSVQELLDIVPLLAGQTFMHVGAGSNLLFTKDYDGIILHSAIRDIEVVDASDDVLVRVGAGVVWDDFIVYALGKGWSGVENLSLIPGEVGASAVQNIGAYGVEVKDVIYAVECVDLFDGTQRTFSRDECRYAYRQSVFKNELRGRYAVTYVTYRLSRHFVPHLDYGNLRQMLNGQEAEGITAQMVRDAVIDTRRAKLPDPDVVGNAGSFFMNPIVSEQKFRSLLELYPQMPHYIVDGGVKIPAGWLIEQCGWKGKAMGRAAVHDRQALVLVNKGGATGEDVLRLCDTVRQFVFNLFGIDIQPEVNII